MLFYKRRLSQKDISRMQEDFCKVTMAFNYEFSLDLPREASEDGAEANEEREKTNLQCIS